VAEEQEPVAWLAHSDEWQMVSLRREHADAAAEENGAEVVPLYRTPQTCPHVVGRTTLHCTLTPLTLTGEEREAIERLCEAVAEYSDIDRKENGCHADDDMAAVAVARGLLKRTQPVGPAGAA
jgi:hypothetical protein